MSISNAGLIRGWNDRTTAESYDYGRWGNPEAVRIYDPQQGGYRPLQQGEAVPAGADISIYTSQTGTLTGAPPPGGAGSGQEAVTGQDRVWQDHRIEMDLIDAQDNLRQLDQVDMQIQQQHEQFMAGLQQERDIARMNAQNQAAQIGVQAANTQLRARLAELDNEARAAQLNFDQRLSEVTQAREDAKMNLQANVERANLELNSAQLNAQQRQSVAQLEQNALQMLADRSGPQDWVKYSNLAAGLSGADSATPSSEISIDPLARLRDVYQEHTPDTSGLEGDYSSNLGGLNQPYQPGSAGGSWEGTLGDAVAGAANGSSIGAQAPQAQGPGSTRLDNRGGEIPIDNGVQGNETGVGPDGTVHPVAGPVQNPDTPSPGIPNASLSPGSNLVNIPQGTGIAYERFDPRFTVWTQDPGTGERRQLGPGDVAQPGDAYWIQTPDDWSPQQESQTLSQSVGTTSRGGPTQQAAGNQPERIPYGGDSRTFSVDDSQPRIPSSSGGGGISTPNPGSAAGGLTPRTPGSATVNPDGTVSRNSHGGGGTRIPYGDDSVVRNFEYPDTSGGTDGYSSVEDARRRWEEEQKQQTHRLTSAADGAHIGGGEIGYAGDSKSGRPTGNEEAVIPIGGSAMILSHEDTEKLRKGMPMKGMQQGGVLNEGPLPGGAPQGGGPPASGGGPPLMQAQSLLQQVQQLINAQMGGGPAGGQDAAAPPIMPPSRPAPGSSTPTGAGPPPSRPGGGASPPQGGPPIMKRMAGGGVVSDTVGAGDPGAFTYRAYDEEDMYNQPFLRQTRGEMPTRSFGNFGGGNTVGRWDLPSNLSLQRYGQLSPTQQQMLQGAYEDPQTGLAFDDVMANAQRASVGTRGLGGGSAYAG